MRILAILALTLYLLLPDRSAAQAPARTGKDYAVFFYVTSFKPGWQGLPTTKTEAEDLAKELQTNYGFICQTVPNPTSQQIFDTLSAWNTRIGPNDQVLFFFSSHGYYDPASKLGYLIAADGVFRDEYFRSWLDYNSLRPFFTKCKAKNILVALDACHSGSFGIIEKGDPGDPDYNKELDCQTQVELAFKYGSRLYVCSGNENARTPGESRFAAKFLGLLRTGAPNPGGIIHFDDLNYSLGKLKNPEPVHGEFTGHEQGGDFVFVRKNACNTAPVPTQPADPDRKAWDFASGQNTEEAYRFYLDTWPSGRFRTDADRALQPFQEERVWRVADQNGSKAAYEQYKASYCPGGLHCAEAEAKLKAQEKVDNMLFIRGGTFQMGSTDGESDEQPVHNVTVRDFYLGKYEVTVTEFKAFIDATGYTTDAEKKNGEGSYLWNSTDSKWELKPDINWRHDAEGKLRPQSEYNHPVIHVSWNDATEYCKWLSRQSGKTYRLPTEAEWEYAAGNGSRHTKYSWGNGDPSGKNGGNVTDESKRPGDGSTWTTKFEGYNDGYWYTAPVGSYNSNDFGLHDMTGNVWEWCSDWYGADYYKNSPSSNPTGPTSGSFRVLRGGSWYNVPQYCRVADRSFGAPGNRGSDSGFRLARTN
jgi:formylglycine-generating enzyme required for sulfatase activity